MEVAVEWEAEELAREEAQEEEEDDENETLKVWNPKRIAKGKAKVILPIIPKRNLPKLDEVPRKNRKLLDASSAATTTVIM